MSTVAQPMPRPYYVGAQNDEIYIVAGERPATSNDYPRHDANRHVVAKVYSAEDAAFIVLCCNAWDNADALRKRLQELEAK